MAIRTSAESKKNCVIFCQAPADIPYVLTIYEREKGTHNVSIFVINVFGMFQFLDDLDLKVEKLVFIPYEIFSLKNPIKLIQEKIRLNKLWNQYFRSVNQSEVYFFSRFEDWLTAAFVYKLSKNTTNTVLYANHYDKESSFYQTTADSFKNHVNRFLLKTITNVDFKTDIKDKMPEFSVEGYAILEQKAELDKDVFKKYQFNIELKFKQSVNVLFFVSARPLTILDSENYDQTVVEIIRLIKKEGWKIIVKGHPRSGIPACIAGLVDLEIPAYLPGEFLPIEDLHLCLGMDTTAICYYARETQLNTFSLMDLFVGNNEELLEVGKQFLLQQSNGKIRFLHSMHELSDLLKSINITKMYDQPKIG